MTAPRRPPAPFFAPSATGIPDGISDY